MLTFKALFQKCVATGKIKAVLLLPVKKTQ